MAGKNFDAFKKTIEERFMGHPVVTSNAYTKWFAQGDIPLATLLAATLTQKMIANLAPTLRCHVRMSVW